METLHKLVLLNPSFPQPDIEHLPFVLRYVNLTRFPVGGTIWWGSRDAAGHIADGYLLSYVKSADVHMNDGGRYAIEEDGSQSVI